MGNGPEVSTGNKASKKLEDSILQKYLSMVYSYGIKIYILISIVTKELAPFNTDRVRTGGDMAVEVAEFRLSR